MKRFRVYGDKMRLDSNGDWVSFKEATSEINNRNNIINAIDVRCREEHSDLKSKIAEIHEMLMKLCSKEVQYNLHGFLWLGGPDFD